jgi:hypothetical protein
MKKSLRGVVATAGVVAAVLAVAGPYNTIGIYQVSGTSSLPADGDSPFASCDISGFSGGELSYLNTEVSPWVAVNPTDPSNIIGVYQQDQFSLGSGRGLVAAVSHDGGQTWSATYPPFSICAGGNATNGGDFQRAREPKVTFSPNGDAYFASRSSSPVGIHDTSVLVSKSTDGGDHWSQPVTLVRNVSNVSPFYSNVRSSVMADPFNSHYVYAVWQRSRKPGDAQSAEAEHSSAFRGDLMFSRTTDGGQTWEAPRAIVMYRDNSGTYANQVAMLPDGTLVVAFDNVQGAGCVASGGSGNGCDIKVIRSTDRGQTWSDPIEVGPEGAIPPVHPDTGVPIRVDLGRPSVAVDLNPSSAGYGNIYAVWADRFGSSKKTPYSTVVFTESTDGGLTWSPLIKVNRSPAGVEAFTPAVAVASDGTVGVTYYDFRSNTPAPGLPTDLWMIHCHAGTDCTNPVSWAENHVEGPFDIERAPSDQGYYLGDYTGLTSDGKLFLPFFARTTDTDQANTYLGIVAP